MEALNRLADRLDAAAGEFAAARPADLDPGASVASGDNPGRLGEVMAALQRQRSAALHARAQEAATAADRLGRLASDLRLAAAGYGGADRDAAQAARRAGGE